MQINEVKTVCDRILDTVQTYFVGERTLLQKVLAAALANGHILFEDNPGLGKTLLAKVFARATGCDWSRVQFTPDLMPADIVGTKVWRMNTGEFTLEKGPVFTHVLLADEINRSPPKVQSALLECMEERQVTIEGDTHSLERPFSTVIPPLHDSAPETRRHRRKTVSPGYTNSVMTCRFRLPNDSV